MAWSTTAGAAVQVLNSVAGDSFFTAENLPITSTRTIRIEGADSSLRLFLNGVGLFQDVTSDRIFPTVFIIRGCYNTSFTDSTWTNPGTPPTQRIWYINSTSLPFQVDVASTDQLFATNVPRQFAASTHTYCILTDLDGATWDIRSADGLTVNYKDPSVIALPSEAEGGPGGWLMVMARYLSEYGGSTQDDSFAQIVAWWSDTSDFRGESTVGPFLLVDGANAWEEREFARLWLGTPGVVVSAREGSQGFDLYVYYSADESQRRWTTSGPTLAALPTPTQRPGSQTRRWRGPCWVGPASGFIRENAGRWDTSCARSSRTMTSRAFGTPTPRRFDAVNPRPTSRCL